MLLLRTLIKSVCLPNYLWGVQLFHKRLLSIDITIFISQENQISVLMQTHGDFKTENHGNVTSKTTVITKTFMMTGVTCDYTNTSSMKVQENPQKVKQLIISNYLCKQQNNTLRKVTELKFGDKTVTLTDNYIIEPTKQQHDKNFPKNSQTIKERQKKDFQVKDFQICKKQLFRKKPIGCKLYRISQKRDTKNIVKNYMKALLRFCEQQQKYDQASKIQNIISNSKFNNSLIEKIVGDAQLIQIFQQFLRNSVGIWIESSRIRDKEAHKQAIQIYLDLISQAKASPQQITNKTTNDKTQGSFLAKMQQF